MDQADQALLDAVYKRLQENITKTGSNPQVVRGWHCMTFPPRLTVYSQRPSPGSYIPQRDYRQGTPIPGGAAGQTIMFVTLDGKYFPTVLALAGQFDRLVDGNSQAFASLSHTINLRIEVSGLFVIPNATAHPISASVVARVQRMVRAGGYHVS
jgi:hypothetical protein